LRGAVDDLAIWNRSLGASEIRGIYNGGLSGQDISQLAPVLTSGNCPPTINCSPNIVAECTGGLTPVTFTVTAADASGNPIGVTCLPPSGSGFRIGQSNVTCVATDSANSSASCSFRVTVVDTIPPLVTCSSNITANATSASGAVVNYISGAADPCGIASFDCSPPPGSTFPVGSTTVTCLAVDGVGNSNSCSFVITVNPFNANRPPVADASATHTLVISANNTNAVVILDGTRSSDPDGNPLTYAWLEGGSTIASGPIANVILSVGSHLITLRVSDGLDSATDTIVVRVVKPGEAIELIIDQIDQADMGRKNKRPFIATLKAAVAAFDRGSFEAGLNQLQALQNKVRAQLGRTDPALADSIIAAAQAVIDAVQGP
jgi:HYR domain-containing protein/PKD domain-containing protein